MHVHRDRDAASAPPRPPSRASRTGCGTATAATGIVARPRSPGGAADAAAADRAAVEGPHGRAGPRGCCTTPASSSSPTAAACACRCPTRKPRSCSPARTTSRCWVEERAVDVGIAGANQVAESGVELAERLRLGFGRCRLVVAAPAASPIAAAGDLAGVRVATSYPATVGRTWRRTASRPTCIPITGSVELAPSLDAAEAIADLVSSGETLRQNGLVELETILESEAVLLAPTGARPGHRARVAELVLVLRSVLAARPKRYLMLNAHDEHADGHRRPPPRSRRADRAAAGARRHARRARCRRCGRGRPAARARSSRPEPPASSSSRSST